jgi:hypothetical protein
MALRTTHERGAGRVLFLDAALLMSGLIGLGTDVVEFDISPRGE